jgi:hypothetical protein
MQQAITGDSEAATVDQWVWRFAACERANAE